MTRPLKPVKEFYTEPEAAGYLNIPLNELYTLLDEYIFNDGSARPQDLTFCEADLGVARVLEQNQGQSEDSSDAKASRSLNLLQRKIFQVHCPIGHG